MKQLAEAGDPGEIRYLLTDVDDTLTDEGQLLPATYEALYRLAQAGIHVIPVTGGCAGWCDQMIRLWPVDAVIGESGAFYYTRDTRRHVTRHDWLPEADFRRHQQRLLLVAEQIVNELPPLKLAADQGFRLTDVAIDYNQEVSGVTRSQLERAVELFTAAGASARISSIHINAWIGDYSKAAMAQRLLQTHYGLSHEQILHQVAFVGDAPNDEPLFALLRHTFGVANIGSHLPHMRHRPSCLLEGRSGHGFTELAEWLLQARLKTE